MQTPRLLAAGTWRTPPRVAADLRKTRHRATAVATIGVTIGATDGAMTGVMTGVMTGATKGAGMTTTGATGATAATDVTAAIGGAEYQDG